MDTLNESSDGITISSGDYPDSWDVYYYPSRGRRTEHPQQAKATVMARVGQCESFRIRVIARTHPGSQIVIEGGGIERRGKDDLYGMSDARHLMPLLWPTDLPPRGDKG